ncbi:hypothetical protein V497_00260 [Pseudogymnoascus sp. VKM F-4516 (FW-969)]|nr:hypothetical protein V497_00260 [Pseudogymnoascus sp. VKM F-4516 (FW-969)]
MISTTCLSYNTWNIKTINFKQDIALISFIKDYTSKEFAFKKLLKLSKEKKLKNSLLLVYVKDVKEIYYVISTLEALSIQELLRNSKGLKKIFNSVLMEEGYIFLRNSSKNKPTKSSRLSTRQSKAKTLEERITRVKDKEVKNKGDSYKSTKFNKDEEGLINSFYNPTPLTKDEETLVERQTKELEDIKVKEKALLTPIVYKESFNDALHALDFDISIDF